MLLPVFIGQKYGYCYEPETGHYLLHNQNYKAHIYLQGDDARMFREQLEHIDTLKDPENNTGLMTENTISIFL